ncbi:hypothetical protein BS78_06G002600 [Paspalum vaginatum]|nr:hypothetical protein BS78_06G002600 [Paspalum vaginatum]
MDATTKSKFTLATLTRLSRKAQPCFPSATVHGWLSACLTSTTMNVSELSVEFLVCFFYGRWGILCSEGSSGSSFDTSGSPSSVRPPCLDRGLVWLQAWTNCLDEQLPGT